MNQQYNRAENMDMQWITHKNVKMLFWVSEQAIDKEVSFNASQLI